MASPSSVAEMAAEHQVLAELEHPLPAALPADRPTAVYLYGSCFHRRRRIAEVEALVGPEPRPLIASAMPRLDVFTAHHPGFPLRGRLPDRDPDSTTDPEMHAYRSGFWGVVDVVPGREGAPVQLGLLVKLDDGSSVRTPLGRIDVTATAAATGGSDEIAICMSTHDPDEALLRAQLDSIRAQTDRRWRCVISDDCSRPEAYERVLAAVGGDERFEVSRSEQRLGVYRGFERALSLAPASAGLIALCDQDDRWHPGKLATLRSAIGDAELVYSDMRVADRDGDVISDTYWTSRRNNHMNFKSLLIANTVTGAASLMRREVAERAMPFPEVRGEQFHDHWLALTAMAMGRIAYVDEPLYDYVQHGSAALGHTAANTGTPASGVRVRELVGGLAESGGDRLRDRLGVSRLRRSPVTRDIYRRYGPSRPGYFRAYLRLVVLARTLLLRCGGDMGRHKRRVLERFIAAERSSLGAVGFLVRSQRRRLGMDETLGLERVLARGVAWRQALPVRTRGALRPRGSLDDASDPEPKRTTIESVHDDPGVIQIETLLEPLELSISRSEPERINLLLPKIDLDHLYGGYIGKLNLARRLAEDGRRVRLVAVNPQGPLPHDWRARVESYEGLTGAMDKLEVAFPRDGGPLAVNPADRFVATTWWSAHAAGLAVAELGRERFLYMIQEYEPFTFPMGSLAALADDSYRLPHHALFSSATLQQYFAARGLGVYAPDGPGAEGATHFENAITSVPAPTAAELESRSSRRLLFYARSARHARRNMFELGLLAIIRAIESGAIGADWELVGVGAVEGRDAIDLPGGRRLEIRQRLAQSEYANLLSGHDVGLALMYTPHPSLVPIEMASAGLLTVTNSYETKTADALRSISPNLVVADPSLDSIVGAIASAVERAGEHEARAAGADVHWSRSWEQTFDRAKMDEITTLLEGC